MDLLLVDVANNKTSKVNATPGAGDVWEFVEICEEDCGCDDCTDALTAGGNEKY